jgi:GGDEF domain-containing protein
MRNVLPLWGAGERGGSRQSLVGRAQAMVLAGAWRALRTQDARCRLPGLRTFLRDGQPMLAQCRASRQAISLAVFDIAEVVHDASLAPELVVRYTAAVVDCLRSVAGPLGLLARSAPTEFSLLMPRATERMVRRMVAQEFARLNSLTGSADVALARPTCAIFSITEGDTSLAEWQYEGSLEVQELAQWSRRLAEDEDERDSGPPTLAMQACNGALVAVEVDPIEWFRANDLPTTMQAPLAGA